MKEAFRPVNLMVTIMEALITALAATSAVLAELPIWAMFVGWIAYFTRGLDVRNALINLGCVLIGLILGIAAASVLGSLGGPPSVGEQAVVVFGLGLVVLSLRFLPVFNNLLGFFLGLVAWFALHQPPGLGPLATLAAAAALGSLAGAVAHRLQQRIVSVAAKPA
jgi:Protein of unknown function (DUF1097)